MTLDKQDELVGYAVRDITQVSIAPASKSAVREIIIDLPNKVEEITATECWEHSKKAYQRGKEGKPLTDEV